MLKLLSVLLPVLIIAPFTSADVFKCVGKGGEDLYQNFPCALESVGWTQQDPQAAKKSPEVRQNTESIKKSPPLPAEPRSGMTADEVKAIWGEPTEMVQEEPGNGPRSELWSYGASRSVRFDRRGRVSAVKQ